MSGGDDGRVVEIVRAALISHFESQPSSASVSFVGVDTVEVLRFRSDDRLAYVTLGMSTRPFPDQEAADGVSSISPDGPRGELLLSVRAEGLGAADVWRSLAVLAAAPAVEGLRYAENAIVSLGEPLAPGMRVSGVVVADSGIAVPTGPGPVTVFEVLPATPEEIAWARVHGVPALRDRWRDRDTDLTDLARPSVDLS